jgi:hypothetical protein
MVAVALFIRHRQARKVRTGAVRMNDGPVLKLKIRERTTFTSAKPKTA